MKDTYTVINLERYDDADFLRANGLVIKYMEGKQCKVISAQYKMAKRFLKGRRTSEQLRNIRRDKQKQIDRNEIFNNL